jgi:indole-3-glycerol phosphate synthase
MDILDKIVEQKKSTVASAARNVPESRLRTDAFAMAGRKTRPFFTSLASPGEFSVNVIAEVKRASPSKGPIRLDLDPAALARAYELGGARALSVLTDEPFFKGSLEDLKAARAAVSLPVLRKEFIVSTYQLYETVLAGADAVLLIVRILERTQLRDYLQLCRELRIDPLVEIYSASELEDASWAGARLIGINNRNLRSFETSTDNAINLGAMLDKNQIAVAASGIQSRGDIVRAQEAGIFNFLIGESLVRSEHPDRFLRNLLRPLGAPSWGRMPSGLFFSQKARGT